MTWLRMADYWTLKVKDVQKSGGLQCTDSDAKSLLVKVAATHAGIVNGNGRFYRPDRMQDSVQSWVPKKGFPKPVLIGHNEDGQTLGRVLEARYIDESYKYANDYPYVKDSLFYRTDTKKVPLHEAVDWIVDNLMGQEDYTGLGYIELGLNITNPEAIRKVLADEYLTVSVGFKTDSAICSVCHQDWATDDKCDHKLGSEVDGKQVFLISGKFEYEEVSFVNFPADPFAGTISKTTLSDAMEKIFFLGLNRRDQKLKAPGLRLTDSYGSDIHIVEDAMAHTELDLNNLDLEAFVEELKAPELTQEQATQFKQQLATWQPATDDLKTRKRSLVSTLNAQMRKRGFDKIEVKVNPEADELKSAALGITSKKEDCGCEGATPDNCACAPKMDEIEEADRAFFEDEEGVYAEMVIEMDAAVVDGELTQDSIKDAKLSSEQRKKLGSSTFCGPGRSFPVPDCAHVTAARRLIGRAKVTSSTKSKILACVSRKASSLGCGSKKDAVVDFNVILKDVKLTAGATPATIIAHYEGLHGQYQEAAEELRDVMRSLHGAVLQNWHAKSVEDYWRQYLGKHGKDATENLKKFIDKANLTDAEASQLLALLDKLDAVYTKSEDNVQRLAIDALSALLQAWTSNRYLEYVKEELGKEQDMVFLPRQELADKEDALNKVTDERDNLVTRVDSAEATSKAVLKSYKRGLASQIVMYRSLKARDEYKDLDTAGLVKKIDELSTRHIEYLKDTVADIISELKWVQPIEAPKVKAQEPGLKVEDNVTVSEEVVPAVDPEQESKEAKRAAENLRTALTFRSGRDRIKYLATLNYEAAKLGSKEN
jgi:hypothetical protein